MAISGVSKQGPRESLGLTPPESRWRKGGPCASEYLKLRLHVVDEYVGYTAIGNSAKATKCLWQTSADDGEEQRYVLDANMFPGCSYTFHSNASALLMYMNKLNATATGS